jgi:RNA polymerase sigma factor (sigma-70 family)
MRATDTEQSALVRAAQSGDRRATHELVTAYLPLVYTIVRRAMGEHPDVDDVVQDTMLRALRELPELRNPASFRAWLSAIAVRQVSTHKHRQRVGAARTTTLDEITGTPDVQAEFENLTMLGLEVYDQRKGIDRAARWLDPDDRALLSLWTLQLGGSLTRSDLAAAIGVSVAHATVRIQRMRGQLHLTRSLIAALDARPGCPGLEAARSGWDGQPSPLWRKRLTRHTRSCPLCTEAARGLATPEHLLAGYLLLPVPIGLTAGLLGKIVTTAGAPAPATALTTAKTGILAHVAHAVAGHPVVVAVVTGTVITGAAVTTATWPAPQPPPDLSVVPVPGPSTAGATRPTARPTPSGPAPTTVGPTSSGPRVRALTRGPVSLESATGPGLYVSTAQTYGEMTATGPGGPWAPRLEATFEAVRGLADPDCFSFRLPDGQYLRHSSWRLRVSSYDAGDLFRSDATFCVRSGTEPGSISLESFNYRGHFLHRRGKEIWLDQSDRSHRFGLDSSFRVRAPLAS